MTIALPAPDTARDADLDATIARLHLRVGMLAIAHAELEELDVRGGLDADGRLALAEARWRTGDLEGASEAANAYLRSGGTAPIAFVIAAESAAATGRPTEARAAITRLGAVEESTLDTLFAGMPRRAFWPTAPNAAVETETLFDVERPATGLRTTARDRGSDGNGAGGPGSVRPAGGTSDRASGERATAAGSDGTAPTAEAGLWDAEARAPLTMPDAGSGAVDPMAELEAARAELATTPGSAALRLAVVLRLDPTLAPQVLETVQARGGAAFDIVRGDAQRLLGRHLEAEASYTAAVRAVEAEARQLR